MTGRDGSRQVARQSGLTSVAATVAIASGLLLDLTVALRFGAGASTDAFVVAARIPLGLLAMVMATGTQVLVPTIATWTVREAPDRVNRLVGSVLLGAVGAGLGLAAALALLAPLLTRAVAPGLDEATTELATELAVVMVLVVPLTVGCEVLRAYLNARYSFVVPAAMTVVLNVVASTVVLTAGESIHVVPVAYVLGGLVQLLVMLGFAVRAGLRPARPLLRDPEVRATARLSTRPLAASGLNPLARVAELVVASFLPAGSATLLHYGNRVVSAIGGTVLFRSVVVALVPRLSQAAAEARNLDVVRLTDLGVRIMLALSLPLAAAMAALALPGTQLLFAHGRFDADSAALLGAVLAVYAASLPGSAVQRALLVPFYAVKETRAPLRNTVYGVGANVLLLPLLVLPFAGGDGAVLAVAAAYSLSQYVHVAHARHRLRRDLGLRPPLLLPALRTAGPAVASGALMAVLCAVLGGYDRESSTVGLLTALGVSGAAGLSVLLASAALLGSPLAALRGLRRVPGPRSAPPAARVPDPPSAPLPVPASSPAPEPATTPTESRS